MKVLSQRRLKSVLKSSVKWVCLALLSAGCLAELDLTHCLLLCQKGVKNKMSVQPLNKVCRCYISTL